MPILIKTEFRTQTRGYRLHIERDLLGDICMVRCWFGLYSKRGGYKRDVFADFDEAQRKYRQMIARRLRRGYAQLPIDEKEFQHDADLFLC